MQIHAYLTESRMCVCGLEMPLDEDDQPKLTFEEWIDYHDKVLEDTLERDAQTYEEESKWLGPVDPPPPPYQPYA